MATVLVTAGPTREHLDDVRFLTNASTGRMGYALAAAARDAGHRVLLVTGPTQLEPPPGVEVEAVVSAQEMAAAVDRRFDGVDIVFGAAAVADARPAQRLPGKPAKAAAPASITLLPNPDILAGLGRRKGRRALIGFALEAVGEGGLRAALARGRAKLEAKQLDAIAVNATAALGAAASEVVVLGADGSEEHLPHQDKAVTAARLVALAGELWARKQ